MHKTVLTIAAALTALVLCSCGFQLPTQEDLGQAVPKLNVEGAYHSSFYKYVVQNLRLSGVEVNSQNSGGYQRDDKAPTLLIPSSHITTKVVAVDSMAQALEENIFVSVAGTLMIPGNKPIIMRNSLTRSVLNKSGFALASQTEKDTVIDETHQELARQMVTRISYLGRQSDPSVRIAQPADLLVNEDSDFVPDTSIYEGMTVIDALRAQDSAERSLGTSVTVDELNNGMAVLSDDSIAAPVLPPIAPSLKHEAPESLSTEF